MPQLSKEQKTILQEITNLAPQRKYWNEVYNAALYELERLGAGPITGGARHYDADKARVSRIGKQLVAICEMCEDTLGKKSDRAIKLMLIALKSGVPKKKIIEVIDVYKKKCEPKKTDFASLRALLHEGHSQGNPIAQLKAQLETASQKEADLLWDTIQKMEKQKTKPQEPAERFRWKRKQVFRR